MRTLTILQARRIALAAQGLTDPRPAGRVDRRHFRRIFDRIGLLQLDSVNVLARSHYLPVLARLGPYDRAALDAYTTASGEVFEYWGHEASLLRSADHPLFRWRMATIHPWARVARMEQEHPGLLDEVYAAVAGSGPVTAGDLTPSGERKESWWGWGPTKLALEWLFAKGRVTAYRDANFARRYDLPERVLPAAVLAAEDVPEAEAHRRLVLDAARYLGVATATDIVDYHRLKLTDTRATIEHLAEAGALRRVEVAGWSRPAFLHPEAVLPRRPAHPALLSPFDPVVWNRDRTERLFGFRYRIEIYTPQPKRAYGYYVLPFLLDGALVGRVDLKADRRAGTLQVPAAHVEPGHDPARVARHLAGELEVMAGWLGLGAVAVARRGNLGDALADVV